MAVAGISKTAKAIAARVKVRSECRMGFVPPDEDPEHHYEYFEEKFQVF
jgi:hypothetical protein